MMKSFFKKLAFVMALAMVVSLAAPAATTAAAAGDLQIRYQDGVDNPTEINIAKVNGTVDLKFANAPDYKEAGFEWTSSNPAVATVDQTGLVTAVAAGTAEITITVGTDREDTVKVNVVDLPTYTATMGTDSKNLKTEITLEVDEEVDFGFFGIKDYDRNRYQCNWFEAGNGSVATVDKNGVIKAIGEGTTVISLGVYNVVTGMKHSVASCTVTVGAKATPVPATAVEVVDGFNTTEKQVALKFTGVDTSKLTKEDIEIYEYHTDADVTQEYIWQILSISVDEDDKNVVYVNGYSTSEFIDGYSYVVRYVNPEGEESTTIAEDTFVASVGAVAKVEASYASYQNNQGNWYFKDKAYTNASSGEEVTTKIFYDLYDANGVNVTGHYSALVGDDLVTIEVVTEDAEHYVDIDEDTNVLLFSDIPEVPVVTFQVTYDDYESGEPVFDTLTMKVEEAPAYAITSIDNWNITITSDSSKTYKDVLRQWVALYDDYDIASGDELKNHEIVLWVTDNYGNKYVTNDHFTGWHLDYIGDSEKFSGEGFELRYETKNPQVLVVGDDEIEDGPVNSSVITTKKVGTATVNVTLYNAYEDELVSRLGNLKISVKEARYVKNVSANSVNVLTDSIAKGAATQGNDNNDTATAESKQDVVKYDPRFTTAEVKIAIKDQYGDTWGLFNNSAAGSIDVWVEATNADIADPAFSADYKYTFDGVTLLNELGEKTNSVSYKIHVIDTLNDDAEKTATFRVSLKYPTKDDETCDIKTKSRLELVTNNATYVNTKNLYTEIKVVEQSTNGYDVNYADDIVLLTSNAEYNKLFGSKKEADATLTKGALFIAVLDPKGNIIDDVVTTESGLYQFYVAEAGGTNAVTKFVTAGTYTVKLMEVTSVKDDKVNTFTTTTSRFTVKDDRIEVALKNQKAIYADADDIDDIIELANEGFEYTYEIGSSKQVFEIAGVRYRKNTRANSVVLQDVIVKVKIDTDLDGNWAEENNYYYVEIPVDKTVALEDIDLIGNVDSIPNGKDPEGNKMK